MPSEIEAYFDESQGGRIFCLAGYIFRRHDRIEFDSRWREALAKYDAPYFHMKEAGNPKGFRHLSRADTDALYRSLLDLIRGYTAGGYSVSFDLKHGHLLPLGAHYRTIRLTPYALCSFLCLGTIRHWVERHGYSGSVACIFEDGHESRAVACRILEDVFSNPEQVSRYFPGSYEFRQKTEAIPLQAADILAWHLRKNAVERIKGNMTVRADLRYLLEQEDKYFCADLYGRQMLSLLDQLARTQNPNRITWLITYQTDINKN